MNRSTLARQRLDGAGWAHPYPVGPFDPYLYADGGNPGDPPQPPAPGAPPAPPVSAPPAGGGDPAGQDVSALPDWAQKLISDARAEAGKARTVAKENAANAARADLVAQLGQVLGLGGDTPPTPEELATQLKDSQATLTSAQEQAYAATIELHVYRTAARLGADADALLDSRAFCDQIDALDADDPAAFTTAVEQAIEAAMGRNPGLRARGMGPGRSGGDMSGGPGGRPDLDAQIADATSKRDFATVIRLKRQKAATTP